MVVLLDPTMLMSRRTAVWVERCRDRFPAAVAMVGEMLGTLGESGFDANLGAFAAPAVWAHSRRVQCTVPARHVWCDGALLELLSAGTPANAQPDGGALRPPRDALIACEMLTAMAAEHAWVLARRPPLFDLAVAAGLTVIARSRGDGTPDGAAPWAAAFDGQDGKHIGELARRSRYLAHALDPAMSASVIADLNASRLGPAALRGWEFPVIEVFDAGPPGRHWR